MLHLTCWAAATGNPPRPLEFSQSSDLTRLYAVLHQQCNMLSHSLGFANCSWISYHSCAHYERNSKSNVWVKRNRTGPSASFTLQLLSLRRRVLTVWIRLKWKHFQLLLQKATAESKHISFESKQNLVHAAQMCTLLIQYVDKCLILIWQMWVWAYSAVMCSVRNQKMGFVWRRFASSSILGVTVSFWMNMIYAAGASRFNVKSILGKFRHQVWHVSQAALRFDLQVQRVCFRHMMFSATRLVRRKINTIWPLEAGFIILNFYPFS